MKKISKNEYFSFLIALEALKNSQAGKDEKDKAMKTILDAVKPYVSQR